MSKHVMQTWEDIHEEYGETNPQGLSDNIRYNLRETKEKITEVPWTAERQSEQRKVMLASIKERVTQILDALDQRAAPETGTHERNVWTFMINKDFKNLESDVSRTIDKEVNESRSHGITITEYENRT